MSTADRERWFEEFSSLRGRALTDLTPAGWDPWDCECERVIALTSAWVFDDTFTRTVLVKHLRRGWVPPGGTVEAGEGLLEATVRELREETGLVGTALPKPALVQCGEHLIDHVATLRIDVAFGFVCDPAVGLHGEPQQEPRWFSLDDHWESVYPHDRERLRSYAAVMAATRGRRRRA